MASLAEVKRLRRRGGRSSICVLGLVVMLALGSLESSGRAQSEAFAYSFEL